VSFSLHSMKDTLETRTNLRYEQLVNNEAAEEGRDGWRITGEGLEIRHLAGVFCFVFLIVPLHVTYTLGTSPLFCFFFSFFPLHAKRAGT
jgi:hypothetical protein